MKYHGKDTQMWDAWFLNDKETVHAFHLQFPGGPSDLPGLELGSVGHIKSDDLLHWTRCDTVLPPLVNDNNPDDYHHKYTGCAITKDDTHYVYYTMRSRDDGSQRIGVSLSKDLETFELYQNNPVLEPDSSVLIGYENNKNYDFGPVNCRDLLVVKNEDDNLYYGYYAAVADLNRLSPVGVIAVATSTDLLNWSDHSIVYVPKQNGVIEVPDVFLIDNKWYLTILCGNSYNGRSSTMDDYVVNTTIYAVADSPRGPFVEPVNNIFIGGISDSGFTCRSVIFNDMRYVMYVDRSIHCWTLSLPKMVKVIDNKLVPCYTDILAKLRICELVNMDKKDPEFIYEKTSFAWQTFGGKYEINSYSKIIKNAAKGVLDEIITEKIIYAKTNEFDYQSVFFDVSSKNIEIELDLTINAFGAGIAFKTYSDDRTIIYTLSFEPGKNRLLLLTDSSFSYKAGRNLDLKASQSYFIRAILVDNNIEVYVDDILYLQCGIELLPYTRPGLFCDRGQAKFSKLKVYELEI